MHFRNLQSTLLAILIVKAGWGRSVLADDGPSPQVSTSSGILIGHVAGQAPQVDEYLGVTVPGFTFAPNARNLLYPFDQNDTFSEDCLTINVWRKRSGNDTGSALKAVMIWVYGGSFTAGGTDIPEYYGARLADERDVIVVSLNYRVNIFGFPGNPESPLNLGLLDLRRAIEWTRDNIAAFGGDPQRINLFGQSAGGILIDYYTFAYPDDPIANGFIMQSNTIFSFHQTTPDQASVSWYNVSQQLGCGGQNTASDEILSCMRGKNFTDISTVAATVPLVVSGALWSFGPTIDNQTVFGDYDNRAKAGRFARRPLLIGNNDNEQGTLRAYLALTPGVAASGGIPTDAAYFVFERYSFQCSAARRAYYSQRHGVPTYRYIFFGDFPNLRVTIVPNSGARHGEEIRLLFNQLDGLGPSTAQENEVAEYMRLSWTSFAQDPASGLEGPEVRWPLYDPTQSTLARFAYQNFTNTPTADPVDYDYICPFLEAFLGKDGFAPDLLQGNQAQYERLANLTLAEARELLSVFQL
ncbi:MAG: hypothetical protein Q9181_007511 [Wetmoreana brouardii]